MKNTAKTTTVKKTKTACYKVQWTNKHSKEQGYVKCLNREKGYFENTYDKGEALAIPKSQIASTIKLLGSYCDMNDYAACEA